MEITIELGLAGHQSLENGSSPEGEEPRSGSALLLRRLRIGYRRPFLLAVGPTIARI